MGHNLADYLEEKMGWSTNVGYMDNTKTPKKFGLLQNYPNPFNPVTTIGYQIPSSGRVTLKVYDILGRTVAILVDEYKKTGRYNVMFDGTGISSGVYFYQLKSGSISAVKKLSLIK
jgi:hypothetical protein